MRELHIMNNGEMFFTNMSMSYLYQIAFVPASFSQFL